MLVTAIVISFSMYFLSRIFKKLQSVESVDCPSTCSREEEDFVMVQPKDTQSTDILTLSLNHGANEEGSLYRLRKGSKLRIVPGPSLLGRYVELLSNYPITDNAEFIRTQYETLSWFNNNGRKLTEGDLHPYVHVKDIDIYSEIEINHSGSFHFYFQYEGDDKVQGSLYIQVEPDLNVGPPAARKSIPLDAIRCQTVQSKSLGQISTWESKLRVAKESGYNMIHFTPIQELGASRSGYSLSDQLRVNPDFGIEVKKDGAKVKQAISYDDVEKIIKKCRQEWGVMSICDIVLNHTANESKWIYNHPEGSYSCFTCPHLRPAFLLDAMFAQVSVDVSKNLLEMSGVPENIELEDHLQALRHQIMTNYLPKIRIEEFYIINVEKYVDSFARELRKRAPPTEKLTTDRSSEIVIHQDPEYKRFGSTINLELAFEIYNVFRPDCFDEDTRIRKCTEMFRDRLNYLNNNIKSEINGYMNYAVDNCLAGARYERVQGDGPKYKVVSHRYPLFHRYFTEGDIEGRTLEQLENDMYGFHGKFFMAHNGWVINCDPLKDFAKPQEGIGNVYLKRELIAWGDSVKLRYGNSPEDSPYLWEHMRKYVETTARIFDGVRLDNCHSTPLHVAEYLLDCARKVNKDLYVVAELFTNSDRTDNIFVNRLGITSLIREAQSAWDSHEEGRLVYRYGGAPVGAFFPSHKRNLAPSIAHALFLDLTHDNPSPVEKRSVFDLMPTAALVSMACCATGSNRGYDELVPHHIHVVDEEREYQEWDKMVDFNSGIIAAKRAFNLLHGELAEEGFNQVFVDQMHPDIVAVTRHSPTTRSSVILVAHTAFRHPNRDAGPTSIRPLRFEGKLEEIIFEAELSHKDGHTYKQPFEYKRNETYINGLTEYKLKIHEHVPLTESGIFGKTAHIDGNYTQLDFVNLRPGSVVAIRVSLHDHVKTHLTKLNNIMSVFRTECGKEYIELKEIISRMNLVDLNFALFQCDQEERDHGRGCGAYDIPNYGALVYCGLQGVISPLSEIAPNNDLGHPLCNNLREGNWLMDYIYGRLEHHAGTKSLSNWLRDNFEPVKGISRYLIPSYFDIIVSGVYHCLVDHAITKMSCFVSDGSQFIKDLGITSLQFLATCPSADLPKLSPDINAPKPPERCVTMSAGLPHFTTGYMRCWGRDTFIALRGLMFLTGRWNEARYIILGFAACLRHGLIPNLLDNGTKPRYNCRDAVWWWLYAIKQYVEEAPNGSEILHEKVSRLFPTDDSEARKPGEYDQELHQLMQEALNVHFQGLLYRERNAGREIDEHMTEKGFNVQIGVNPETGFVFGGNDANCGTWMDKMGSSDKAGNRGRPSTPRDGSAIELVGLQYAVLRFLQKISEAGSWYYETVERTGRNGEQTSWTYKQWADLIAANFEKYFYVGAKDDKLVNKINIIKDTYGSSQPWTDYQLRCNFPIALVVAPDLLPPQKAWNCLETAKKYLLGPLGMKTLDPDDWAYRGNYDNSNDSTDAAVSHGANYHQGPEWVWPIGFYLRARLIYAKKLGILPQVIAETRLVLSEHLKEIHTSHWRGLPELTNEKGSYCRDSCRTQAWSVATVLEVLYDLQQLEK